MAAGPELESRLVYSAFVAVVALVRLAELARARRNTRALLEAGAREAGRGHYPAMVALHVTLLLASPLEVWAFDRPWVPWLGIGSLFVIAASMALRWWVMATLGPRWTTRIVVLPGERRIAAGPFRLVRHPNYLAVSLEVPAIPLVHTAWLTAAVLGAANLALLAVRIRAEDRALAEAEHGGP